MGGIFMKKIIGRIGICLLLAAFFWAGALISDRQRLNRELIRLHVVANSDSQEDQYRKLLVRDAVTKSIQHEMQNVANVEEARQYLQKNLPFIQKVADHTLKAMGCDDSVVVSLCKEAFDTRMYDTFTLPAGVYHALRIVIGEGAGRNWWCVVFPSLCIPAASDTFQDTAAGAGFPETLTSTLQEEDGYELRFAVLDLMGKMENILFPG